MSDHLTYDGQTLKWLPAATSYRATSGLPGHQTPAEQCAPDEGPIPPGDYHVQLQLNDASPYAFDDGTGRCKLTAGTGIQYIPRGGFATRGPRGSEAGECEPNWANWGWRRVRLEPADTATTNACRPRRGGFYIHDSSKGYTHGCIEVEQAFFTKLIDYARKNPRVRQLRLTVAYKTATTDGGTKGPALAPPRP